MSTKTLITLATGLEDPEKVTVAFLVSVQAAERGRETLMFLTKEAVRLALDGFAVGVACEGCVPLPELVRRYAAAGGRLFACPVCFNAKALDKGDVLANAEVAGAGPMFDWIGDEGVTTLSF